jgi:hypothetical protein
VLRVIGAVVASVLLLCSTTVGAFASDTWCDIDPPVVIITPGGNIVLVYVVDSGPVEHLVSLLTPRVSYTVQPAAGGHATNVNMTVTVPNDLLGRNYAVGTEVWSGLARLGTKYTSAQGTAGTPIQLQFQLAVP